MKRFVFLVSLLLTTLLLIGFQTKSTKGSLVENSTATCADCADAWGDCKQKVKFVGREGSCASFRCEVGTKNEHIIKTSDEAGIKALLKIADSKDNDTGR